MKRITAILIAALLLLPLAACAGGNAGENTPAPAGNTAELARDPYEDYNNRFMIRGAAGGNINWAETEDYLFFNSKYLDKKTGECELYCSRPECMHNDETCEADFGVLGIFEGKLYGTRVIPGGDRRIGLYTQNIDGSERKLIREIAYEEMGYLHFHRGKIYSFIKHGSVVNGAPLELFRLILIDPNEKESRILFEDEEYPGGAGGWLFFRDDLAYMLLDYSSPEDAEEYPACRIWELWTYDIEKDVIKLALTDTLDGVLRGCWITQEGEIYAAVEKDYEAEKEEDWRWSFSLAKLEDGKFVKLWDIEQLEGLRESIPQVSDGTVVTQYCDDYTDDPNVRFRVQDLGGNVIADGYLPFPDFGDNARDFEFERYEVIWSDGKCLWLQFYLKKPIMNDGFRTYQPLILAVKYELVGGGYSTAFTEPVSCRPGLAGKMPE